MVPFIGAGATAVKVVGKYGDEVASGISTASKNSKKADDPWLVRFGEDAESVEKLANDATKAKNHGFPHGVSTRLKNNLGTNDKKKHRVAKMSEVKKHFQVEQTGKDIRHHTVHLPNPVTETVADIFNKLFKRLKE